MTQDNQQTAPDEATVLVAQEEAGRDTDRRSPVADEDRQFLLANLLLNGNEQRSGFGRRKEDVEKWH